MIKIGVIGSTGYTGQELVGLLLKHPKVQLNYVTSVSNVGKKLQDVFPQFQKLTDLVCEEYSIKEAQKKTDLVFMALPHGKSMPIVHELSQAQIPVIDLGSDFRLKSKDSYLQWYHLEHLFPEMLDENVVYGLSEWNRKKISTAKIVANPGCFPTAALLGLIPLMNSKIEIKSMVIDAKSGVSGAGKTPSTKTHFPECNENFSAYKIMKHQHTPEIEMILNEVSNKEWKINFLTHLLPINRGILSTQYLELAKPTSQEALVGMYQEYYKEDYFVRVSTNDPEIQHVVNTNFCDIGVYYNDRTQTAIIISVIDNLVKGAAGQAIQNMNLILNFDEKLGLI